ncbi:hypothetical protein VA7868_01431 [Vibrio aerogenes CECT 7868]|uniref:Addiction module toxin RelE n=1 Tax=Vibrio aerogenes CECT 7868 TaxID=1216006 RepID=A0A1M5Y169_9VIBR|nr:type II toxin-antitoxin system RelE/ParE family toxin [Vibrio aerogenes]SHI05810.1 hypothetical protein VA7868_01431 [Vibrio aerogenes CECT 7868]
MSEKQKENKLSVYQTNRFEKQLKRLSETQLQRIEDEIDLIIENPKLGTRKKGDLSHLWVHKFNLERKQILLGYSWVEDRLELYLLNIGPHENYYETMKKSRRLDLKTIG